MADSDPVDENTASNGDAPSGATDFSRYNIPTDLTAFQTVLLCLIHRFEGAEGVTLQNALEGLYPKDINHGRLYPSLDRMVDSGLISKQTKESDKRRKEYALTGRGEWVTEEYLRFVREMIAPHDE
ncbi:helix-turn-helix transcriptional regulator [Haladaptatus sp. GCM10025707]|uniref:helix-turn-helix transcriptional regulator n=1 Tax=unclassified Haladaptatus TaxID=2622732 RepID=UPI0023E78A4C|nr:helix-turn-helix transcriptional regulator [Haladaptatus sp. QDMS2]